MSYVVETLRRLGRQDAEDEYRRQIAEKDRQIAEKDRQIAEKDRQIAEKDRQIAEKDRQIAEKDRQIAEKDRQIAEKDRMLRITVSYMHDDGLSPEEIAERTKADVETIRELLELRFPRQSF